MEGEEMILVQPSFDDTRSRLFNVSFSEQAHTETEIDSRFLGQYKIQITQHTSLNVSIQKTSKIIVARLLLR